ncbi:hypothetical protein ACPV56_20340 [Vibrio astriarenae]
MDNSDITFVKDKIEEYLDDNPGGVTVKVKGYCSCCGSVHVALELCDEESTIQKFTFEELKEECSNSVLDKIYKMERQLDHLTRCFPF